VSEADDHLRIEGILKHHQAASSRADAPADDEKRMFYYWMAERPRRRGCGDWMPVSDPVVGSLKRR
jgi:hypothetical protein